MQDSPRKTINPPVDDTDSRTRALGMLELLMSAQVSAELHRLDKTCIARLEKCAQRLRAVHELSAPHVDDDIAWMESSLPALLRLLVYLQAEAADGLGDTTCASHLQKCVTRLMRVHRISPDQLCAGEGDTCH